MKKKYECSIHGNEGNVSCQECWDNLRKLAEDNNTYLSVSAEDLK